MNKLKAVVLTEALRDSAELDKIFYISHRAQPEMSARAKLFIDLTPDISARLLVECPAGREFEMYELLVDEVLTLPDGKDKIISLLAQLPINICYEMIFYHCGPIKEDDTILAALTSERIAAILDFACKQGNAFHALRYLDHFRYQPVSDISKYRSVTRKISLDSWRAMAAYHLAREEFYRLVSCSGRLPVKKLVILCSCLPLPVVVRIFLAITNSKKAGVVAAQLPPRVCEYLFKKRNKGIIDIPEHQINAKLLPASDMVDFFRKYPDSPQFANLNLVQKVDAAYVA